MNLSRPHKAALAVIERASHSTNIGGSYAATATDIALQLPEEGISGLTPPDAVLLADALIGLGLANHTVGAGGRHYWVTDKGRDYLKGQAP